MSALTQPTVRVKPRAQSATEDQRVYRYAEKRDGGICLASRLDTFHVCEGPIQRHHAGLKMGMAKITDVRHVTLLCRGANVGAWARIHDREVMQWLADIEDALERAQHDEDENARDRTEQTPSFRDAMVDAGRGSLLR